MPYARRLGLRFVCGYAALYWLYVGGPVFQMLAALRVGQRAIGSVPILHVVVPWIAAKVLHLAKPVTVFTNGSGDTTYDWLLIVIHASVAAVVAILWTVLDRKATHDANLLIWLRFGLRTFLAFELLSYGLAKLIPTQFGALGSDALARPLGSYAPMGVLWISMAASPGYTVFAGAAEVLAGVLLLVPRLSKIGALAATMVMTNVFALNLFFDVPVKLLSLHLLIFALFLAAPDFARLRDALVTNRTVPPAPASSFADRHSVGPVVYVTWFLAIVFFATDIPRNLSQRSAEISVRGYRQVENFHLISEHPVFNERNVER